MKNAGLYLKFFRKLTTRFKKNVSGAVVLQKKRCLPPHFNSREAAGMSQITHKKTGKKILKQKSKNQKRKSWPPPPLIQRNLSSFYFPNLPEPFINHAVTFAKSFHSLSAILFLSKHNVRLLSHKSLEFYAGILYFTFFSIINLGSEQSIQGLFTPVTGGIYPIPILTSF